MTPPVAAVFDCNVYLQAMLNPHGPAGACWTRILNGETSLYIAPFIIAEIRELPNHKKLRRFSAFTPERVQRFIDEILNIAKLVADPVPSFNYPRDPDDALYVDLAIATHSLLIVSNDKDLLDLMNDENPEGKALRSVQSHFEVLTPTQFLIRFQV